MEQPKRHCQDGNIGKRQRLESSTTQLEKVLERIDKQGSAVCTGKAKLERTNSKGWQR